MWNKAVVSGRIFIAVLALAAVALAVLQSQKIVPPSLTLTKWITFSSLLIIALDNIVTLIHRTSRERRRKRDDDISDALMALLLNSCKNPSLRFEKLGACVYVGRRTWKKLRRNLELVRIVRFRPSGPQQSGVVWRPGKGAVGEAWEKRRTVHKDLQSVADKYGEMEITESTFDSASVTTRSGFTYSEFVSIVGKYSEVIAEPIWRSNKVVGVVALDREYERGIVISGYPLNSPDIRGSLSTTAALIGTIISTATESAG